MEKSILLFCVFSLSAMEGPPRKSSALRTLTNALRSFCCCGDQSVSESTAVAHIHTVSDVPYSPPPKLCMPEYTPEEIEKMKKKAKEREVEDHQKLLNIVRTIIATAPEKINDPHPDYYNQPLLFTSVNRDSRLEITKMLLSNGANINLTCPNSNATPLVTAIIEHQVETVKELISNGADCKNRNLLHMLGDGVFDRLYSEWPAQRIRLWTVLLDAGVDPNEKDNRNSTCLHALLCQSFKDYINEQFIKKPETKEIFFDQRKALIALLLERGLDPESRNNKGQTALESGIRDSYSPYCPELVDFLKEKMTESKSKRADV